MEKTEIKETRKLMNSQTTLKAWENFLNSSNWLLHSIKNENHYEQVASFLDTLLEEAKHNNSEGLNSLINYVTSLIQEFDQANTQLQEATPAEVLNYLMNEHQLKQRDLSHIIPQSVLSQVLNGKRQLTTKHIKDLANYFKISTARLV